MENLACERIFFIFFILQIYVNSEHIPDGIRCALVLILNLVHLQHFHYFLHQAYRHGGPFGNCLPGTKLLQTLFRMKFSMGSLSRQYQRSLRHHRRFLQSYRRSLRRSAVANMAMPIVARLTEYRKTLNIVKHHETLVKHCDTS